MTKRPINDDSGIYIAIFYLSKSKWIMVGALGRFHFAAGIYAYVGSAQKNLTARLERHARRSKILRWHLDYLSTRATMMGALILPAKKSVECRTARTLAKSYPQPIPGFGCSDCHCKSHLFYLSIP